MDIITNLPRCRVYNYGIGLVSYGFPTVDDCKGHLAVLLTLQKLAEDEDDGYSGAAWASGQSLKAHFSGVSAVRLPR